MAHWRAAGIAGAWHWIWGSHYWEGDFTEGHRGDLVAEWSLDEVVAAFVGTYSSSASEAAQISDVSYSITNHLLTIHTESPLWTPACLLYGSATEQLKLGVGIGYEGQRELAPKPAFMHREGNNCRHLNRQHIGESSDLHPWLIQEEKMYQPPLLQLSLALGQGFQCWERGKCKL